MWLVFSKKKEVVDGHEIKFLCLPWWLLIGGHGCKSWFTNAMCIVHYPSRTAMIFISSWEKRSRTFRYALYHEYWENLGSLGDLPSGYTKEKVGKLLRDNFHAWEIDVPNLREILTKKSKAQDDDYVHHLQALAMELALARREMPPSKFREFLDDAMSNRL